MEFARRILQNYGWKEGDGLGKNKNGIAKPLKATLKFDNAGFGTNQATDDFNNHWWERVFNEAATNVNVSREGGEIKMSLKDDEKSVEISTKNYSMRKLKKLKKNRGASSAENSYENFLQAATLTNLGDEVENPNKIDAHDIVVSRINVLTDEELFKACGGRTAHKGARHGLKLSGKLSRIEEQEAKLLATMLAKRQSLTDNKTVHNDLVTKSVESHEECYDQNEKELIKEKKKKRKHSKERNKTNYDPAVAIKRKRKNGFNNETVITNIDTVERVSMDPDKADNYEDTRSLKNTNQEKLAVKDKNSHKKKKKNKEKHME